MAERKDWEETNPDELHPNTLKAAEQLGATQEAFPIVEANIHRACSKCRAPSRHSSSLVIRNGYSRAQVDEMVLNDPTITFEQEEALMQGWPEVYVMPGTAKEGKSVGDTCLHCGNSLIPPEYRLLGRGTLTDIKGDQI